MRLKAGEKAPDFELLNEESANASLSDYHGMWVLLYFYPGDDSPGCIAEAKALREVHAKLNERDTIVLGVSTDDQESHQRFKEKYELPYPLLSDEEGEVADLYGVLDAEKGTAKRASFLINAEGVLAKIYTYVEPDTHAKEVLQDLEELQAL